MEIGFIIIIAQIYRVPFIPGGLYWLYSLAVVYRLAERNCFSFFPYLTWGAWGTGALHPLGTHENKSYVQLKRKKE